MRTPKFWWQPSSTSYSFLLHPISYLFRRAASLRAFFTPPQAVSVPVICIGNLVVGGAGKTPTTLALARLLKKQGHHVAIISRGYKGRFAGPLQVNPTVHTAQEVGDEPLLLAQAAPTWIARNRYAGAQAAVARGATVILLDDGLQNPSLSHTLRLCVVDSSKGFGNGQVMPAGPLREPLKAGLQKIDGLIVIGSQTLTPALPLTHPHLRATLKPVPQEWEKVKTKKVVAFAGIGFPEKFFDLLTKEHMSVEASVPFPDHHFYTAKDLQKLHQLAQDHNATLVTTEKDWVRLPLIEQQKVLPLPIFLEFDKEEEIRQLLKSALI